MIRGIRSLHDDTRGVSLTELLVGTLIGALIMGVVVSTIFTAEGVRLHADDRSQFAADLSITSLSFDRDGVMAAAGATAKAQIASISCATAMDLGFLEGGATVRYRTVAGRLERTSGSGTRTMVRNVSSCTWQSIKDGIGRYAIVMTLALTGTSGETLAQSLRAAPRSW
jgi:Tfp pilus assembly protein PilW